MDTLEAMRAFAAVAQDGSFTSGAKRLGRSTKLVSKQVAWLEARLGLQLFNRTTRRVALTDAGRGYEDQARRLLDQFDELEDRIREKHRALSGPIRITAPTAFGSMRLPQALSGFQRDHPGVAIDLVLTDNRLDLVEEGIDLAIRVGLLRDSSLIAKKLSDMPVPLVAAPDYLSRAGTPTHPDDLSKHNCLVVDNSIDAGEWRFRRREIETTVKVGGNFRAPSPAAIANMAIGGAGIARCPLYVADAPLSDGRLVRVLPDYEGLVFGLYALYPPSRHMTPRVRALLDHLDRRFHAAFGSGVAAEG